MNRLFSRARTPKTATFSAVIAYIMLLLVPSSIACAEAFITEASYYTVESCLKESGQFRMANGRLLNDKELTVSSWDYSFGQRLRLTDVESGRQVTAIVSDRGPAKRLYKKGRRLDVSKRVFEVLSGNRLDRGLLQVEVTELNAKVEPVVAPFMSKATTRVSQSSARPKG